jgi:hypothetical protein
MKYPAPPVLETTGKMGGRTVVDERSKVSAARSNRMPSAQAWFAGGERIGYNPKARTIVAAQNTPLKVFLRQEGELAHAVSFLPGFPDGSFGWAKVQAHLLNAPEIPKLFLDFVSS